MYFYSFCKIRLSCLRSSSKYHKNYRNRFYTTQNLCGLWKITKKCVLMGAHYSAVAWELVGILLLGRLRFISGVKKNNGIYSDDGIILLRKLRPRKSGRTRKHLIKLFKGHNLNISTNINGKVINFLDVTFELSKGLYKPYAKDLRKNKYVDRRFNHDKRIFEKLHNSVQYRSSTSSRNKEIFDDNKPRYNIVRGNSNHDMKLEYVFRHNSKD